MSNFNSREVVGRGSETQLYLFGALRVKLLTQRWTNVDWTFNSVVVYIYIPFDTYSPF